MHRACARTRVQRLTKNSFASRRKCNRRGVVFRTTRNPLGKMILQRAADRGRYYERVYLHSVSACLWEQGSFREKELIKFAAQDRVTQLLLSIERIF